MIIINKALVKGNQAKAAESPRRRLIKTFSEHPDKVQRMINSLMADTYARPHRHKDPAKSEVFIALTGKLAMVTFTDEGAIKESAVLCPEGPIFAAEVEPGEWHMIVSLEDNSTAYEIIDGPYDAATHKDFAPWAPEEGSAEAAAFLDRIKSALK